MKKEEVRVGATYAVKVSGSIAPVRITQEKWSSDNKHTGWIGVNTKTKRPVRIKSAQKLRHEITGHNEQSDPEPPAPTPPTPPAAPAALPIPGEGADAVGAVAGPDGGGNGATAKGRKGKKAKEPKAPKAAKAPKAPKPPKPPKEKKPKKLSGLDAAALVLKKAGKPMNFKDITERVLAMGWTTNGKTPQATLYAAAIREIAAKGKQARFKKTDRGLFEHTGVEAE